MITSDDVLATIRTLAEEAYPEESCGFLLGRFTSDNCHVEALDRAENTEENLRTRRYEMAPDDYHRAEKNAREHGLDIVGFFHSHPDHPAHPSQTDLAEATFPGYRYVIVSVQKGRSAELTAWTLQPDRSAFINDAISTEYQSVPL